MIVFLQLIQTHFASVNHLYWDTTVSQQR